MNKKRRIKDYWDLIESDYQSLDLARPPSLVLSKFSALPERVANLMAAHWCQEEVLNGGFIQFFANSSGILAPEAMLAFSAIGLPDWAGLVEQATHYFGPDFPRERELRAAALPIRPPGTKAKDWDPFFLLDSQFYAVLKHDDLAWERAANAYALKSAV